ncbi:hypothetical protein FF098_006450 [Parvularcula flava]|uniref:Lipoprotein n=1 Tax=Aquisalinus luteolus TaxID=1566827 RepID=A0A8J3EQK0_9PROT|nr:hypothetical protein [Aquisalinus luteolus]NHK27539.1 hypothetical protein [Aquisalinus luteolus]GGH95742.1 hypothetical protein GCM10011355_13000 [Aquisalinus luteolus]
MIFFIRKSLLTVLLLVAMSGCVGLMPVKGPLDVDGAYRITLGETWSAYPRDSRTKLRNLTIDGEALNSLTFAASLEDGHTLIRTYDRQRLLPVYRSDMSQTEVVEFIRDSLSVGGMADATITSLRPEPFGALEGVRFDVKGATQRGLNMSGTGKAAIEDGKLHLIIYTAPTEYYFGLHEYEVNEILASIELL